MTRLKTVPGSIVTGPALWGAAKVRLAQWDRLVRNPAAVEKAQTEILRSHLRMAAKTELGREHGYDSIRTPAEFAARVPLRTYADYEPYLERMRKGTPDVIWPGLIKYFGLSSGSSSTAAMHKYLPISDEQIGWTQKAGFDVVARYLGLAGDRSFTGGFTLGLLPPAVLSPAGPIFVISNPGLMQLKLPPAARLITLPRPPVRDIEDYDKKLTTIAETYLDYDIRALSGTTCWFSILFDRVIAAARAKGRKVDKVGQIWPNLRALFGGGIHAEPYRRIIDERVGHPVVLIDNYNATEGGLFSATDRLGDDGMVMIPDRGVYFEFVRREDAADPHARRLPLWQVEPNVDYSVVLTTASGLFAYVIGDFVRFTSTFPHRLKFAGRASGMLSLTQELTSQLELESAVTVASSRHPCTIVDFAAAPEVGVGASAKGRYLFFVEFERDPSDLAGFARSVDEELCVLNRVYREHRMSDVAILAPKIIPLKRGATRQFMQALGQTSVQNKFPRIVSETRGDLLRSMVRVEVQS